MLSSSTQRRDVIQGDLPTYAGHLTQGCKGRWIDISTLAAQAWTCSECRATVPDPEALEPPGAGLPPENPNPAERAPPIGFWPVLVGVLIGVAMAGGILWFSLFYGTAN